MWYRIELNKDRSVRTCAEVECSLNEGRSVHYVEADSKEAAIAKLAARYDNQREACTKSHKKRVAARKDQGVCIACAGSNGPRVNANYCAFCRDKVYRLRQERRDGRAPLVQKRDTEERKSEAQAGSDAKHKDRQKRNPHRSAQASAYTRRRHLTEALGVYDRNPNAFRAWLVAELDECRRVIESLRRREEGP